MSVVKERMTELIQTQPEDSSYEEILKELAFGQMIERGLKMLGRVRLFLMKRCSIG